MAFEITIMVLWSLFGIITAIEHIWLHKKPSYIDYWTVYILFMVYMFSYYFY